MADNPHPNLKPWPKGQSGNPKGQSKGRRIKKAVDRFFEANNGLAEQVVQIVAAMATGQSDKLKDKDGKRLEPDLAWMKLLIGLADPASLHARLSANVDDPDDRPAPYAMEDDDPRYVEGDELPPDGGDPGADAGA